MTLDEIGPHPEGLARISRASGVNVIMGCGWYREFAYPPIVEEKTSGELADVLVKEIEEGVGNTGIRAGFIGEGVSCCGARATAHWCSDHDAHNEMGHARPRTDRHAGTVWR